MNKIPLVAGCIGAFITLSFGAFSDDFSDEATSNTLWAKNNDAVTLQFAGGACEVINSDTSFLGLVTHAFAENEKPSTFTLSGKITLGEGATGAGFACCVASSGMPTGYYISIIENEVVSVNKIGSSGSGTMLTTASSAFLTEGTNELKISRKEGKFNIFCNGQFCTSFEDDNFTEGNMGLLVSANSSAVFDDIVLTDDFIDGGPRTCFADDFSSTDLAGWSWFGDSGVTTIVEDSALHITTKPGEDIYQVFDLPLTDFAMRVVASHRGLSTGNFFGLFLCGKGDASIPLVGFGITGDSKYGVFLPGQQLTPTASTSIKGDPYVSSTGDTTYYYDTLEVIKRAGSDDHLFIANGDTLSRFSGVNFDVTGAGLFCFDSLDVLFDDFAVANGTEAICPVKPTVTMRRRLLETVPTYLPANLPLFDLKGRQLPNGNHGSLPDRVPGMYLFRTEKHRVRRVNVR